MSHTQDSVTHDTIIIGMMSGTSLDGVDAVLASFPADACGTLLHTLGNVYLPFSDELRSELMALQSSGPDEIRREAVAANTLAQLYSDCVAQLLAQTNTIAGNVHAIGVHGQTIRHRPELGFTRQLNNPARLAELTKIDVIADFRSRDVAAGGQGAPLVPAFHQAVFAREGKVRVVANIGGISNISVLNDNATIPTTGFDTGPGNVLMDAWITQIQGKPYDENGAWAATGTVISKLLQTLCDDPYFALPPPKSTGRDLFDAGWLAAQLGTISNAAPADVQATLAAFTATTLADAIVAHAPNAEAVYICGGGAHNANLLRQLQAALANRKLSTTVDTTAALGIPPSQVESLAFAWLAHRFINRLPGNLPAVTGATGLRILGALYPA